MKKSVFAAAAALAVLSAPMAGGAFASTPPKAVKKVPPDYPRGAERRGIEGYAIVQFSVNSAGVVVGPTVIEAQPAGVFDTAAIRAIEQWKYEKTDAGADEMKIKLQFAAN